MAETVKTKSGLEIEIRRETPEDYAEVNALVGKAFSLASDGVDDTAEYLIGLRGKDVFIPELSFAAVLAGGRIVGQITLYKTDIVTETGKNTQLNLSPISVLPEFFGHGIAREMIVYALAKAKEMGYAAVFLRGDPNFYKRFGFEPTYRYGIYHKDDAERNAEDCLVKVLASGGLDGVTGVVDNC